MLPFELWFAEMFKCGKGFRFAGQVDSTQNVGTINQQFNKKTDKFGQKYTNSLAAVSKIFSGIESQVMMMATDTATNL